MKLMLPTYLKSYISVSLFLLSLCAAALIIYAPFLPRLILEGYPKAVWPASGNFATVKGIKKRVTHTPNVTMLDPTLHALFNKSKTKAFLAYQENRALISHYAKPLSQHTKFNSYSMVKSLVGLLVFKAVSEEKIASLETPLSTLLPEFSDSSLKDITLADLMDMKSGIMFQTDGLKTVSGVDEKDMEAVLFNPLGPMAKLHVEGFEKVSTRLSQSKKQHGTFSYQNINTAILAAVLENIYHKPVNEILSEKLWQPAGAQTAYWRKYNKTSSASAYCCLYASPQDWIRLGLFILNNGSSQNTFLRQDLWDIFMGTHISKKARRKGVYQNHARHDILDRDGEKIQGEFIYFLGQNGQILYLIPKYNLVVVRFGEKNQLLHTTLYATWRSILKHNTNASPHPNWQFSDLHDD